MKRERIDSVYTDAGEELGRKMAERGMSYTFGGGKSGMMGAVGRGVKEKNGYILGISPKFFEENSAEISFVKVKGHSGIEFNEMVDKLAVKEVERLKQICKMS